MLFIFIYILGYLHEVSLMSYLEPLRYQFHLNQTIKDRNHFLSNFFFEEYGFTNIQTIEVLHGGFACALILEHEKGQASFFLLLSFFF